MLDVLSDGVWVDCSEKLITLLAGWFLTEYGRWYMAGLAGVPRIGLTGRLMSWRPPRSHLAGLAGWLLARLVGWAV